MTERSKAQRNLNRQGRLTPYDVRVAGTFMERPRQPPSEPRDPTPSETRANNISMVNLMSILADLAGWIPMFRSELEAMNLGKRGAPFKTPDSLILWMISIQTMFNAAYRPMAGFAQGLLTTFGVETPSYSRFNERARQLIRGFLLPEGSEARERFGKGVLTIQVSPNVMGRVRRVGIDSSGINLSDTTLWRTKKWGTTPLMKGWLHIHALCDVDSGEIIAFALTDGSVGDAPMLRTLVSAASEHGHVFDTLYADGAYASDENWILLCRENDYTFITSFKVNTSPTNNGCVARGDAARTWCSLPYDEWVRVSGYGTRWKCECVFSDLKRIFPETVTARTTDGMVLKVVARVGMFNEYKELRASIMGVTGNGVTLIRWLSDTMEIENLSCLIYRTLYDPTP